MFKTITATIIAFLAATSCDAQWAYMGLGGITTNQLTIDNDTVYASTSNGLYKKYALSTDTSWQQVSFSGRNIVNCLFLDNHECLLEISTNQLQYMATVLKSADRGQTAIPFTDTGMVKYNALTHLAKSPYSKDTLYLLIQNKKTYDGGQTWLPLGHQQSNDNFVYVDPANSKNVFVGGESMILSALLQHSSDNGQNWQVENTSTVFAGDNALHVLHNVDGYWFAGGEGIVVKRDKSTGNWSQLLNVYNNGDWALYMFGLAHSPVNKQVWYASGLGNSAPANTKMRLLRSADNGQSWDSLTYTLPQMTTYGAYDLKVHHSSGQDRVWMGGKGVFIYKQNVINSVDKISKEVLASLGPNPARDYVRINWKGQDVQLHIYNAAGQVVWEEKVSGKSYTDIPVKDWAAGVYEVKLSAYENTQLLRFIKE